MKIVEVQKVFKKDLTSRIGWVIIYAYPTSVHASSVCAESFLIGAGYRFFGFNLLPFRPR